MSERSDEPSGLNSLAAEYVIGTLDADERAAFTARLATDETARRAVADWERRLAPLGFAADEVRPPVDLWSRIERALGPRFHVIEGGAPNAVAGALRSRDRWRGFALSSAGIAAALVVFVAAREIGPLRLRNGPGQNTDEGATYVAAVNRGGDKPALIVTVDLRTRKVLVRPVSAEAPPGRSLQLWYVGKGKSPRSMGLVTEAVANDTIPDDAAADAAATFAVSVEPPGGSTTGGPTGAVLYSGQLVKE